MSERLSWDEYAMRIAEVAALRSEDPFVKVGACALNAENKVIGVAYNGLAAGKTVEKEFWLNRNKRRPYILHAEANLLSLFKKNECATIACTLLPCSQCAAHIVAHGVKRVLYRDVYETDKQGSEILKFYNVDLIQVK